MTLPFPVQFDITSDRAIVVWVGQPNGLVDTVPLSAKMVPMVGCSMCPQQDLCWHYHYSLSAKDGIKSFHLWDFIRKKLVSEEEIIKRMSILNLALKYIIRLHASSSTLNCMGCLLLEKLKSIGQHICPSELSARDCFICASRHTLNFCTHSLAADSSNESDADVINTRPDSHVPLAPPGTSTSGHLLVPQPLSKHEPSQSSSPTPEIVDLVKHLVSESEARIAQKIDGLGQTLGTRIERMENFVNHRYHPVGMEMENSSSSDSGHVSTVFEAPSSPLRNTAAPLPRLSIPMTSNDTKSEDDRNSPIQQLQRNKPDSASGSTISQASPFQHRANSVPAHRRLKRVSFQSDFGITNENLKSKPSYRSTSARNSPSPMREDRHIPSLWGKVRQAMNLMEPHLPKDLRDRSGKGGILAGDRRYCMPCEVYNKVLATLPRSGFTAEQLAIALVVAYIDNIGEQFKKDLTSIKAEGLIEAACQQAELQFEDASVPIIDKIVDRIEVGCTLKQRSICTM